MEKNLKIKRAYDDVYQNHNWCWAKEIDYRYRNDLDFPVISYRGTEISYRTFKEISDEFAKSLKALGYGPGMEVPVCMSNSPEIVMLMRAVSLIGAKLHVFGDEFADDYKKQIISKSNSQYVFVTDDKYPHLQDVLDEIPDKKIVMFSLADSLPKGKDPYLFFDQGFYDFQNRVSQYKSCSPNKIIDKKEFLSLAVNQQQIINNETTLDDEFLITYTSGSTNGNHPSAIVHKNSSLICMGRIHDKDISDIPETKHMRILCHIPTHSNTDLITSISDAIMQRSTAVMEPIYNENFFLYSLMINKVNFAPATRCFWLKACKMYNDSELFQQIKFPELFLPTIVGEPKSSGEEKYINATLKKMNAGIKKLPKPIGPVVVSFGGGDCEHGGIFFTLYPKLMEKLNKAKLRKDPIGLKPFAMVQLVCLNQDGQRLAPGEIGLLAANSPLTMKEYKDEPDKTEKFYITDEFGKKWGNMNVYGYIDKYGYAHMKGRNTTYTLPTGEVIPLFMINDAILKDSKNILSSEVVITDGALVAHVEAYPDKNIDSDKLIVSIMGRLKQIFPASLMEVLYFRIRSKEEAFPLTGCGKRSSELLVAEGLNDNLLKASDYINDITRENSIKGETRSRRKNK